MRVECSTDPSLHANPRNLPADHDPGVCAGHVFPGRSTGRLDGLYAGLVGDILQDIGILQNDVLIRHWDGTRLAKDARFPRTEVQIASADEERMEEML